MGHALTENRNGFVVEATLTHADGTAERTAAIDMLNALDPGSTRRITLGADKGYDTTDFVADLRRMCVTPHVAAKAKGEQRRRPGRDRVHPSRFRIGPIIQVQHGLSSAFIKT